MSLFLDASAVIAMLAREPEGASFSRRVDEEQDSVTSALSIWESTRGLANARKISFEEARSIVADYLREFNVRIVPIGADEGELALDAHERFGKGRHRASLNLGDCFVYACAKRHAKEILFKGEDFIHTDLKDAMLP